MNFHIWLENFNKHSSNRINGNVLLSRIDPNDKFTQLVEVKCECGTVRTVSLYALVKNKNTQTCGRCNLSKIEKSGQTTFNSLTIVDDIAGLKGSDRVRVKCSCGNIVDGVALRQIVTGKKKTCGLCAVVNAKKTGQTKFGKLTLLTPLDTIRSFCQRVDVVCECGNKSKVTYRNLATNNSQSCGKCKLFAFVQEGTVKWNRLTLTDLPSSIRSLSQLANFRCECGNAIKLKLYNVMSGHTTSCGQCYGRIRTAYDSQKEKLNEASFPISPGKLFETIEFRNVIRSSNTKLDAVCPICKNKWAPRFKDVRRGFSLSCGCSFHMTSEPQKEIFEYVKSMGFDATCEARIGGLKYDVFVPSAALAIEYHGLAWHSTSSSKRADLNKQAVAAKHEVCLIVIYEDEWREKRKQMCDIMSNRLGAAKSVRKVRPSKCEMMEIPSSAADVFYERNHYIGKTGSNLNVCAMLDGKIVACMSFKRPNRQSKHTFELTRMASDPEYRIHGIWSKMFKILVGKTNPESVVSFSDNRLFTGNVYEKLGFEHDGNVRPNYYWVKGRYRFNKSGLRKPPGTTQTEHDLRMSQGYAKLWDLGKKRWVWRAEQD